MAIDVLLVLGGILIGIQVHRWWIKPIDFPPVESVKEFHERDVRNPFKHW